MIPYKGDRSITHFDETICNKHMYYMATIGRPFSIYSATTEMLIPMVCFIRATFEQPAYLATLSVRLFWTFIENLMPTMASMAISEHPVYHLKMTSTTIQPYEKKTWPVLWLHKEGQIVNILFKRGILIYNYSSVIAPTLSSYMLCLTNITVIYK